MKIHHIGLVVPNIRQAEEILEALGLTERTEPQVDPIQKVAASFLNLLPGNDVYLELLEPSEESSPITGFLKSRGGGLHHLCFEVKDMDPVISKLTEKGFSMVTPPVECKGFDRTFGRRAGRSAKIAFFMAEKRLLIELLQRG